jgi:hypothetical protein
LSKFCSQIECFGTVGVGYVWNVTFRSIQVGDAVLASTEDGNFFVREVIPIHVAKFCEVKQSATLFWLPFWVPNDVVSNHLSKILKSKVVCSYIRITHGSLNGCYTTQSRLVCPAGLTKLPHFIHIPFEDESYRCFTFVPGRPPVCFACGDEGHMRNQCPAAQGGSKLTVQPDVSSLDQGRPEPVAMDVPAECPSPTRSSSSTSSSKQSSQLTQSDILKMIHVSEPPKKSLKKDVYQIHYLPSNDF